MFRADVLRPTGMMYRTYGSSVWAQHGGCTGWKVLDSGRLLRLKFDMEVG